jgi:hypothetical protein
MDFLSQSPGMLLGMTLTMLLGPWLQANTITTQIIGIMLVKTSTRMNIGTGHPSERNVQRRPCKKLRRRWRDVGFFASTIMTVAIGPSWSSMDKRRTRHLDGMQMFGMGQTLHILLQIRCFGPTCGMWKKKLLMLHAASMIIGIS